MDSGPYKSQGTPRNSKGSNYAKWIGGGLGWAFGGPIGGILGFMFGSMMDGSGSPLSGITGEQPGRTRSGDFNISLLILTAAVMKADGRVTRNELDYVKQFLSKNYGLVVLVLLLRYFLSRQVMVFWPLCCLFFSFNSAFKPNTPDRSVSCSVRVNNRISHYLFHRPPFKCSIANDVKKRLKDSKGEDKHCY